MLLFPVRGPMLLFPVRGPMLLFPVRGPPASDKDMSVCLAYASTTSSAANCDRNSWPHGRPVVSARTTKSMKGVKGPMACSSTVNTVTLLLACATAPPRRSTIDQISVMRPGPPGRDLRRRWKRCWQGLLSVTARPPRSDGRSSVAFNRRIARSPVEVTYMRICMRMLCLDTSFSRESRANAGIDRQMAFILAVDSKAQVIARARTPHPRRRSGPHPRHALEELPVHAGGVTPEDVARGGDGHPETVGSDGARRVPAGEDEVEHTGR
jgi:hypothetical protein